MDELSPQKVLRLFGDPILKQKEEELFKSAREKALTIEKNKKGYMIADYYTERILAGHDYSLTLDDVERYLSEYNV